jgi:hypothetical protein
VPKPKASATRIVPCVFFTLKEKRLDEQTLIAEADFRPDKYYGLPLLEASPQLMMCCFQIYLLRTIQPSWIWQARQFRVDRRN